MTIDLYTIQLAMSTVVITAGVMLILDTFLRRPDAAGRIWSVAFMAGILTSFSYEVQLVVEDGWWAVAIGNAAIVLGAGLLWSGTRVHNGRPPMLFLPVVGAAVAAVAVLVFGPDGGGWAGAPVMFVLLATAAALGTVEALRPPMRRDWASFGLTATFAIVALFCIARLVVFVAVGPDDPWFAGILGTGVAALVFIVLAIVTVTCMIVLRTDPGPPRGTGRSASLFTADTVLPEPALRTLVTDWLERASFHDEQLVLARVRLDQMDAIERAFGRSAGAELAASFARAVRRYSRPSSAIGAIAPGELVVVAELASLEQARRNGRAIQAGLRDGPTEEVQGLRISASIGLAGTDAYGYDLDRLLAAAAGAADAAQAEGGDAIVVAE